MANSLRVMLLTAKLSHASGGLSVSVPHMAFGIDAKEGIDVDVMGTIDPKSPDESKKWGPRVHAFPVSGPIALQRAPAMEKTLELLAPDLIDVQGLWTWSSKVSHSYYRRHGKPYIVTPRGMLDPWARKNSRWKKILFANYVENAHLRDAHCFRATAEMECQHIRDLGFRNPIAVVPNGIDLPTLEKRPLNFRRRVVFLSRIHPKKGIKYLINAWSNLESRFADWDLIIAGIDENGYEKEMVALAQKLNLKNVKFLGSVFGVEKQKLLRSADLFVLPTHAENFGLVIAEALAQEIPVITTHNAPWSGLHRNKCGWWIPLEQAILEKAMFDAMNSKTEDLHIMGKRGRAWMQTEFAWENVVNKMHEVYLWVAKGAPAPNCIHF